MENINQIKPVRFPKVWLTYRRRIRKDLDRAFAEEGAEQQFNSDYVSKLGTQAKQLEEWLIKLLIFQIALTCFQIIGFFGTDAQISLFGITLRQAAGVKELLLGLYALTSLITWCALASRDTTLIVAERVVELTTDEKFVHFAKLAAPTAFNSKFYGTRSYEDWIFPTKANKAFFWLVVWFALLLFGLFLFFSVAVNVAFFIEIYRNPTLGRWSEVLLGFVALTTLFGGLLMVRLYCPMRYEDNSINLEIEALKETDPRLYQRKIQEVYGPNSKYRKFTLRYRFGRSLLQIKSKLLSPFRRKRSF